MVRQIIQIDEEKCDGCGICADACHEGAIEIIDGKAKLTREDFCDGFGDCLPGCPAGAITFIEKDTLEYDEEAVMENKNKKKLEEMQKKMPASGCPGSRMATFNREAPADAPAADTAEGGPVTSQLAQWPCQIKLVPVSAPYFAGAKLLIAADCTAYAYANMHREFMRGKVTLIGCPKLDQIDYSEKLTHIIAENDIKEVVCVRMEVPCCGGLENAMVTALKNSGKFIPWRVVTISVDGRLLD